MPPESGVLLLVYYLNSFMVRKMTTHREGPGDSYLQQKHFFSIMQTTKYRGNTYLGRLKKRQQKKIKKPLSS